MTNLKICLTDDLQRYQKETWDDYIASYSLTFEFRNTSECTGVLNVNFDVRGFGIDGFEGGIDVSYELLFFEGPEGKLLEDDEAFVFIFTHFGKEIRKIVDTAWDVLYEHYENGMPITIFKNE
ncbi:hypothetical protein [Domibacillus robiginosus]|uniref:hypothetical protein n=1 Tax=Domibacillus robiginosus TaxID=1071054 RepID=UPI00067B2370|nr:hypothetical protein [Domibacillus robiginosus]